MTGGKSDDPSASRASDKGNRPASWYVCWLLGVLALILAAALASERVTGPVDDWDWVGTLGEWLSALGTLAAVAATLFLASRDRRRTASEHANEMKLLREQIDLAKDQLQAQADREALDRARGVWAQLRRLPGKTIWAVEVHNTTAEPVYAVQLDVAHPSAGQPNWRGMTDMVPPGQVQPFSAAEYIAPMKAGRDDATTHPVPIRFADSTGAYWERDASGGILSRD